MAAHTYSVLIYKSSITSTYATPLSTANVAYSFNQSYLTAIPEPATPVIRPLEGRAEAQSWSVGIVDSNSTVTSILSDSTGRFHLLNRILGVRRTVDGSTATWLGVGRIADVTMDPSVASYTLTVDDEHRLARITDIFTTNTTRLFPAGPAVAYGPFLVPSVGKGAGLHNFFGTPIFPSSGTQAYVQMDSAVGDYDALVTAVTADMVSWSDYRGMSASSGVGNYKHLRLRVWSSTVASAAAANTSTAYTDCPVIGFPRYNASYTIGQAEDPSIGLTENDDPTENPDDRNALPIIKGLQVLVCASTTVIPNGAPLGAERFMVLHAMGKPPTAETPLHIGGVAGLHPARIAELIYGGSYSTSGARLPRYSTSAIQTLKDDNRFPRMRFRITDGRQTMARWLEDHIYAPNMMAPVTDAQGRIAPVATLQPQSSGVVGYTFTGANLREPHPSFSNTVADQVTVAEYDYTHEMAPKANIIRRGFSWMGRQFNVQRLRQAEPSGFGGDLITVDNRTVTKQQRTTVHGRNVVGFGANGWHTESLPDNPSISQLIIQTIVGNKAIPNANIMGRHLLDRFADGAVTGELHALSTAESVQPGDYVKLTLGSYPNAETNARGGDRIVQMLSKRITPYGPSYTYLDAGPSAQPCTAPSVTVSAGPAGSTKHSINVAIGGISGRAYAQIAFGATRPPSASDRWEAIFSEGVTSTAAQTVGSLPSGTTVHVRAWNLKPTRFASAYAYSSKRATANLAAPTSFLTTVTGGNYMSVKWGAGETLPADLYALRTASTSIAYNSTNYVATVGVGVTRYTYTGLTSNSSYTFGLRHRDIYGGLGNTVELHDQTTGANLTAGAVTLAILVGGST